jgi:hypothetical protein
MTKALENLFSANHRAQMIARYGYTDAMLITVKELEYRQGQTKEASAEKEQIDVSVSKY